MRPLIVLALFSTVAFASPAATLPRGDDRFELGWSMTQVDSALSANGVEILSRGFDYITAAGSPGAQFVEYRFATTPDWPSRLWKVTTAYPAPYKRQDFEGVRGTLEGLLGEPSEVKHPSVKAGDPEERVSWVDALTAVELGARWTEPQDPVVDRMVVTWTDRKLQKQIEIQRKKQKQQHGK
jgi:hypothetical protein